MLVVLVVVVVVVVAAVGLVLGWSGSRQVGMFLAALAVMITVAVAGFEITRGDVVVDGHGSALPGEVPPVEPADPRGRRVGADVVDPQSGPGRGWLRRGGVDELTGLPGRRCFLDAVGRCLAGGDHRARSSAGAALLLIDLDRMRDVNAALGPEQGDCLLAAVGHRLRGALPGSDLVARVDGNAFAVLLRGADVARAERVAGRLREILDLPVPLAGIPVRPEASVGIAHAPEHGRAALELFGHAEEAMHLAKHGRLGQAVYVHERPPISRARLLLRAEVRQALDSGQIELSYQPKADLRSGRISGVEALVRWRHPVDGVRPPEVFLAEIERSGLMPKLTVQVLDQALADCARWHGRGAPLAVSVNVPASVIVDHAFVGVVRAALARHRLPPSALVIEITEDTLIVAREVARGTLAGLRRFGVRVSLDDYGTGFCSLSYLRELPADEVKLDRTFLRDLDRDPAAAEIVRSTVSLAHALRLRIVAEGVETQRSWASLAAWQCDEVQGYFVSRPMAAERVVGWLREWGSRLTVRSDGGPAAGSAGAGPGHLPLVAPAMESDDSRRSCAAGLGVGAGAGPMVAMGSEEAGLGRAAAVGPVAVGALVAPPAYPGQWSAGFRGSSSTPSVRRVAGHRIQADLAAS